MDDLIKYDIIIISSKKIFRVTGVYQLLLNKSLNWLNRIFKPTNYYFIIYSLILIHLHAQICLRSFKCFN